MARKVDDCRGKFLKSAPKQGGPGFLLKGRPERGGRGLAGVVARNLTGGVDRAGGEVRRAAGSVRGGGASAFAGTQAARKAAVAPAARVPISAGRGRSEALGRQAAFKATLGREKGPRRALGEGLDPGGRGRREAPGGCRDLRGGDKAARKIVVAPLAGTSISLGQGGPKGRRQAAFGGP